MKCVFTKFLNQILLTIPIAVILFSTKLRIDRVERHEWGVVNSVKLHFFCNFKCIRECLRNIGKHLIHLCSSFQPLLFRILHSVGVINIPACAQTYKSVVSIGIFFVNKMNIVTSDNLYIKLLCNPNKLFVNPLLHGKSRMICIRTVSFMTLQFNIIIITENLFVPLHSLFGVIYLSRINLT